MVEENAITADTTWKDLKRSIEEEDAYKAMDGQPGGARDVFDDLVADLRRQVLLVVYHFFYNVYGRMRIFPVVFSFVSLRMKLVLCCSDSGFAVRRLRL